MTIVDPAKRRAALAAARSGFFVSLIAFVTSVAVAVAGDVRAASAAEAGLAQVITPFEVGVGGSGALLAEGDSQTEFSLNLPVGAACTADSASGDYRVHSYMVPASVDPATLTFGNDGPVPFTMGEPLSDFRAPLFEPTGSGYISSFTAEADEPGGPGSIINIPAFSFVAYDPQDTGETFLPAGEFNIGIACWGPGSAPVLDKFWNVTMTIVADDADTGPVGITWTADNPESLTTSSTTSSTSTSSSSTTSTTAGGSTTTAAGASTTSTSIDPGGSTTSTTAAVGVSGGSTGPSTGVGLSALARTGSSVSIVVWGVLLLVFGRMAVLLARPPKILPVAI